MIYSQFTKKFQLPDGFVAPNSLVFENLVAIPLNRKDVEADMEAFNSS